MDIPKVDRVMLARPLRHYGVSLAPGEHGVVALALLGGIVYATLQDGTCEVVRDWTSLTRGAQPATASMPAPRNPIEACDQDLDDAAERRLDRLAQYAAPAAARPAKGPRGR